MSTLILAVKIHNYYCNSIIDVCVCHCARCACSEMARGERETDYLDRLFGSNLIFLCLSRLGFLFTRHKIRLLLLNETHVNLTDLN